MLSDYPADTLYETIPDFHNTGSRFQTFCGAVKTDNCSRAQKVKEEIDFAMSRALEMTYLTDLLEKKELPEAM